MDASRNLIAAILLGAAALAAPAQAADGIRMGDNNRVNLNGEVNGAQTAVAIGVRANAQNAVGSILSGGGVRMGDNNTVSANGVLNGAQTAVAIGIGANAQNAIGSVVAGNR